MNILTFRIASFSFNFTYWNLKHKITIKYLLGPWELSGEKGLQSENVRKKYEKFQQLMKGPWNYTLNKPVFLKSSNSSLCHGVSVSTTKLLASWRSSAPKLIFLLTDVAPSKVISIADAAPPELILRLVDAMTPVLTSWHSTCQTLSAS